MSPMHGKMNLRVLNTVIATSCLAEAHTRPEFHNPYAPANGSARRQPISIEFRKITRCFLVALISIACLLTSDIARSVEDPLVMGIFPRRNVKVTIDLFDPLAKYLSSKLDRQVILETSKNFKTFWTAVENRKYDIVHYNQYHYIVSHHKHGYKVFAKNEEFGAATLAGSIIVHRNSSIKSVADLKGKTILFGGGPKAMQSYIVATYLLNKNGLYEDEYKTRFAKNPPNAILSTYYGLSDAAGAGDIVLKFDVVKKHINTREMKYLVRGEQLPHLPWAAKKNMNPVLRKKIQLLMTSMGESKEGLEILKKAKLTGLVSASDKEFNNHRKIIKAVLNEEY